MVVYKKGDNLFYINLNCGYTTFENIRNHRLINYYWGYPTKDHTIFFICRDPYKRLESFYRDKIIENISTIDQSCHKKLLKYFSHQELLNYKVSFEQFIHAIGNGFKDDHIALQCNIMNCTPHYIIKLERGLYVLSNVLGINPDDYITNTTSKNNIQLEWTREMRLIVNKIYAADFIKLGYSML